MTEKRFFKIHANIHVIGGENNYVKLFDLLDGQAIYNEGAIANARFVKNASAEKNYLYKQILKSLNSYHAQKNSKQQLYSLLSSVEVLYNKGLFNQCIALLGKAKNIANKQELFSQLLVVLEMEQEVLLKQLNYDAALASFQENAAVVEQWQNLQSISTYTAQAYRDNLAQGSARGKAVNQKASNFNFDGKSKRATLHWSAFNMTSTWMQGDTTSVLDQIKKIIAFYEEHTHLMEYTPMGYVSSLFIQANAERILKLGTASWQTCERLLKAKETPQVKNSVFACAHAFYYARIGQFQLVGENEGALEAAELMAQALQEVAIYQPYVSKPVAYDLLFQFAVVHFKKGELKIALTLSIQILNDLSFKVRDDFMASVHLFNSIIHVELGNTLTLDYLSRSAYNYFRKKKYPFLLEKLMTNFLAKQYHLTSKELYQRKRNLLLPKLEEVLKDPNEKNALNYFNFVQWLRSFEG